MRRFPPIKTSILERNPQPATLRSSRVTDSNQLLRDHAPVPASTCDGTRLGWCHKDLAPSWYIWRNFNFFLRNFRDTLPSDNHNMAGTSTIDGFLSYEPPLVRDVPLLCLIPGGYVTRCNWHMGITLQKKKNWYIPSCKWLYQEAKKSWLTPPSSTDVKYRSSVRSLLQGFPWYPINLGIQKSL